MAYHILHYDLSEMNWSTDILTFQYFNILIFILVGSKNPLSLDMGSVKLPCGNYTVSEINVSRYEFESASAENGSVDGQNVNLNVFEENKAKASFTNKINNCQSCSHRSIKVNHIK